MNIQLFEHFNSNINEREFYYLYNKLVYIKSIDSFGTEYRVSYTREDGVNENYVGSMDEIKEDFKDSNGDRFDYKIFKKKKKKVVKKDKDSNSTYNIEYWSKGKKVETIDYNVPESKAYMLKNVYKKDFKYRMGEVRVVPN